MLNPEKIWREHLTDLSTYSVICSHFTLGNPKKIHFQHYYLYTSDYFRYLRRKQIAAVILLFTYCCLALSVTCIALVLHLGHATGRARVLMWTCWGWWQRLVATWAEFQHSVLYYATDQCRKRLKACINADSGHSERLLWHCLPDIPVIHHNRFFSEPPTTTHNWLSSEPPTSERTQQTFSQMKKFRNSQVSVVTFSDGVGKWITVY